MTISDDSTPALGVKLLASTKNLGNTDPIGLQTTADLINEVALRAALKANNINSNGKKKLDAGTWVRWGVGLFIMLVGILWGVSVLFAERPTETKVERMINSRPQHLDSKVEIARHAEMLRLQELQIGEIKVGIKQIGEMLGEIKADLKKKK